MSNEVSNFGITSAIPALNPNDPRISVGRFTYGNPRFRIWSADERISIGSFCSIADCVSIFAGGEHNPHWVTTFPLRIALSDELAGMDGHPATKGPTIIGNDVWIGDGARILSGVCVGDGAIIGAGSIVTRDVPAYSIVAGNPAKIIRYRFTPGQIESLLALKWWDWPVERIKSQVSLLCGGDITEFLSTTNAELGQGWT